MPAYFQSTRHPWASFLFLLPLLAAYEGGVYWLGGDQMTRLRDGADQWLRWQLELFGAKHMLAAPAVVVCVLLVWSWWRWSDRPEDPATVWFGMAFESVLFAVVLWQFSQNFGQLVERSGIRLDIAATRGRSAQVLTFIGVGIYEEAIFRLGLFTVLCGVLRAVQLPKPVPLILAAVAAAVAFAAAHHVGRTGEPMNSYVFLFRALAGLYFTALFVGRGFGVAVGAHAGYDILVGVT